MLKPKMWPNLQVRDILGISYLCPSCMHTYPILQVIDISSTFSEDFKGWAAPLPRRLPATLLSVSQPLDPLVWLAVVAAVPVVSAAVLAVARAEARVAGTRECPGKD